MENDYLQVMEKRCSQCLFSNARIVSEERMQNILEQCARTGKPFECHKATIAKQHVTCRGFYDAKASLVVRLAILFDRVRFVRLEDG